MVKIVWLRLGPKLASERVNDYGSPLSEFGLVLVDWYDVLFLRALHAPGVHLVDEGIPVVAESALHLDLLD